jgi:hypothetical protein
MTAKSSPDYPMMRSNGLSPLVGSLSLQIASGFLKISFGPTKPFIALLIQRMAASVLMAADAPLESESYFPALIALNGI